MRMRRYRCVAAVAVILLAGLAASADVSAAVAAKIKHAATPKPRPAGPRGKTAPAPSPPTAGPIDTEATHALIIETETGAVLLDKGADQRIPTASLSKVMTAYVVFDLLKKGRAKL